MQILLLILFLIALLNPLFMFAFIAGLIFFLPFFVLFSSMQILFLVPVSLWQTFTDKQVRRNHALEHATANVIEEKYGKKDRVAGMAFKDGFYLYGDLPPVPYLIDAAREGLARLRNGETGLALHPRCGTSLAVAQFILALIFVALFFFIQHVSLLHVLGAFAIYAFTAKPLGLLAQKYITTSTDVDDIAFGNVSVDGAGRFYFHTQRRSVPFVFAPRWWRGQGDPLWNFFRSMRQRHGGRF